MCRVGYVAHLGEKPESYRFLFMMKPEIKWEDNIKMDKCVCNAFIWLKARISGGFCEQTSGFLDFIICRGFLDKQRKYELLKKLMLDYILNFLMCQIIVI